MRILLTSVAIEGGGAEQVVADLAMGLAAAGHDVDLSFLEGTDARVPALREAGIECHRLLARRQFAASALSDFTPSCVTRLRRVVRDFRPDVIHSHIPRPTLWMALAKRLFRLRIPLVYTEHSVQEVYPRWAQWVYRVILPVVDHVTGVSEAATQSFATRWGWPDHKVGTIWNGIDVDRAKSDRGPQAIRSEMGVPPSVPVLLNVARIIPAKAQEVLVRAMARVHMRDPEAQCWIAGTSEHGPAAARLVADTIYDLHAEPYIRTLGERSDVSDLLAASDIFVLSSRQEGFPITILEAMAAGKPVVATDVGGCAEAVVDGETGLIVPPEDPKALAEAVLYMLARPDETKQMGEAGRKRVEEHFTVEAMVRRQLDVYELLLAARR